ncbi:UNKNOWN [Stylonychia lemnae]|uniref:Histidine acid phosphatase family protein n=1 Tax=Stylonychia lemnae TaxID=5949 RepID=A0A078B4D9_STYLE|nr:UNKNOWN [Stylonychia lemnae]|eukprot:CDW88077.1 UNKNOWN [Stylonychia lemnae]
MGLYPPNNFYKKLSEGEHKSLTSNKGMPKIQIRKHTKEILNNVNALIDGYTLIPVFAYHTPSIKDDLMEIGCPYARDCWKFYTNDPGSYTLEGSYVLPQMRDKIGAAFNLSPDDTKNLNYVKFYYYGDILMAENFEGDPKRAQFSNEEWYYIRLAQKNVLSKGFDAKAKTLYETKFFRKPLAAIDTRVNEIMSASTNTNTLRYIMYSAHDTQIINALDWLQPVGREYIDATYVSTMYFEVFYDTDCLAATPKSQSCFNVHITHNGIPIKLQTCLDANVQRNSGSIICQYDDFLAHIDKIKLKDDVEARCMDKFTPPSGSKI